MKMKDKKQLPLVIVAALALVALALAPAMAKSSKSDRKPGTYSSAKAAAQATGAAPDSAPASATDQHEYKPGPAWKTVGGTVKHIKGNSYTVEDYEGNQVQLYVGQGTKQLRGNKKVGDTVRAEITRGGFANSIQ